MIITVAFMLIVLALSSLVLVYVAFPHRGKLLPRATWLGDAMSRVAQKMRSLSVESYRPADQTPSAETSYLTSTRGH